MGRALSIRTMYLLAGLAAAVLSGSYSLIKLRQECGAVPLVACVQQALGAREPGAIDRDGRAAEEARRSVEQSRREREEAERRIRAAEDARRVAEEKRAAEQARRLAEEKERTVGAGQYAALPDLGGTWRGVYAGGLNQRPVDFVMTLQVGNTCRGRIEEPNTFGHPSAPKLYANVECRLQSSGGQSRLMFRKVYDGTGGQSHSVDYDGEVSLDGRRVTGTWRVGTLSGTFSLIRQ